MIDIMGFIASAKRIFFLSKKPTLKEYTAMAKITAIGILLIALIGFVIIFVFRYFHLGS